MSRSALLVSLVLHAGVLALAGWSHPAKSGHAGLGTTEIGVAFSPGDAGGLVMEEGPAAEPAVAKLTIPVYEPGVSTPRVREMNPVPTAVTEMTPPPITTTATLPLELPPLAPAKKSRSKSTAAAGRSQAMSKNSGAGASGGGGVLGGGAGGGGAGYVPPQFLMRYKPPYPDQAREMRLQGVVLLLVSVDAGGHVTDARLSQSCGHQILDQAALSAVRSWRFLPARQAGQAISATVEVPIRFHFSA